MRIKVLGLGCPRCKVLYAEAAKAIEACRVGAGLAGGLLSGSLALLSDAAHNLGEWGITHATLEPELESCGQSALLGCWEGS